MDKVQDLFCRLLQEKGLECSEDKLDKYEKYYQKLTIWNEKMNLTGITDREKVYIKHFYDSVSLSFYVPLLSLTTLADIGSGAGFPSVPLKIMFPHLKVTVVDSLNKRIRFLSDLTNLLELDDVECIHGRAEDLARLPKYRDKFEIVTARAVARLNVLNELCLPFVAEGGCFAAMKGSDPAGEVNEAAFSLKELHSRVKHIYSFRLPVELSGRHIIVIEKMKETPAKYPRKAGLPLKTPLI